LSSQNTKKIQRSIHNFSEVNDRCNDKDDDYNQDNDDDDYDYEEEEDNIEDEEYIIFSNTIQIFLKSVINNIKKLVEYEAKVHKIFVKNIPVQKILDPINYVRKNNFKFTNLFKLNFKSASDNPNAYDDEEGDIDKWWDNGLNNKEILKKLAEKRKKFFSWNFRYEVIVGLAKFETVQWKIAFLNSDINSKPQNENIKKDNVERFIVKLKKEDLFEELEEELLEYLEFEKFCLDSEKIKMGLLSTTENHVILDHGNYKITKILITNLCSSNRKDLILAGGNQRDNLFLKNAQKEKQLFLYDLSRINCLFNYEKIDLEIKIRKN
jgi:hypothetical protein